MRMSRGRLNVKQHPSYAGVLFVESLAPQPQTGYQRLIPVNVFIGKIFQ